MISLMSTPRSLAFVSCLFAALGCDPEPQPPDARVPSDAPGLDAPGLDAPGLDAPHVHGDHDASGDAPIESLDATADAPRTFIGDCEVGLRVGARVRTCILFPSGVRAYDVPPVEDSFGRADPPSGTTFADSYAPSRTGECSARTHDRYWVRARDGHVYRTWHPTADIDVETGARCTFGHEHGDDPRTSALYTWAGGIPFGIANRIALLGGHHRHEDHFGHKVVVQNDYEAALGNGPTDEPIIPTGFHCYWLSKVHQGTHSGDALGNNEHEYQNNIMCDDGAMRHPEAGRELNAGPTHHTEASVRTLTTWGRPAEFKACDGLVVTPVPGEGRAPVAGSDTNREIKCAVASSGWTYQDPPTQTVGPTGHVNFVGGGIDELWKPWMTVTTRAGQAIFTSSAYYVVRNPARVYNPLPSAGGFIPRRDVNGDGTVDLWIPTLEVCLAFRAMGEDRAPCRGLPTFPASVPQTEWWTLPESPFDGTIRIIHPKGTPLWNGTSRGYFCTDYTGQETGNDPTMDARGFESCPEGEMLQYVAPTVNLWDGFTTWGPRNATGHVTSSTINARNGGTQAPGYGHEWVRFFDDPSVHAPN